MKAKDVLTVLNEGTMPDLDGLEFCVITKLSPTSGARHFFDLGEIMVVDKFGGREPWGQGRKPSKWDIEAEYVSSLAEAQAIRDRVLPADSAV